MADTYGYWPFQIAIPDDEETCVKAPSFCSRKQLSLRVRGPSVMHGDRRWAIFCFTYQRDAEALRNAFVGRWGTHLKCPAECKGKW